ncbi:type 1 glutamine amidotransferase domain-containing protein [uncultured Megasphaera sp.]|uniref:type 1 glutamine amidotransferase domain-containing protein n=1 Tax=uncultured Megasphaera sp. TaxID=165188 RepID=UPI00259A97FF|nr:type 1 glutamine amidotransferase domain-containing protein [uncultured Megasphaera sp.]
MRYIVAILLALAAWLPFTFGQTAYAAAKGTILVVASSQKEMTMANGTTSSVGFFLNELAVPAEYLQERGYRIVLATPDGQRPYMDQGSNAKNFFGGDDAARAKAYAFTEALPVISLHEALAHVAAYDAVFVPGGHAPMTDLMQDPELGKILAYFHAQQKPTAFICHGLVAALSALPDAAAYRQALVSRQPQAAMAAAKDWIYKGYTMTVFSDGEEWPGEVKHGTEMPFHVEQALQIAGATVIEGPLFQSHIVHDRELITGQNPASDLALGKELADTLDQQ